MKQTAPLAFGWMVFFLHVSVAAPLPERANAEKSGNVSVPVNVSPTSETNAGARLAAPSEIKAEALSFDHVRLTWKTVPSATPAPIQIERRKSGTPEWRPVATVKAGQVQMDDKGLLPGTKYYYRLRVAADGARSEPGPEVTAVTPNSIPAAPSDLAAVPVSGTHVNLSWKDHASNETGYRVERSSSAKEGFSEVATLGPGVTRYEHKGLVPSTAYRFRVRARNTVGHSKYSNEISVTMPDEVPAPPSNLTAFGISKSEIQLRWMDNSTNEAGFEIERRTSPNGASELAGRVGRNVTAFRNANLKPSTTYTYRIRGVNATGRSKYSNESLAATQSLQPRKIAPVIMAAGYENILQLQIKGSSKNWLLSDISPRKLQKGYEWWYFVGGESIRTTKNLKDHPWKGNHPGRVLKMAVRSDVTNLATWVPWLDSYDRTAGLFFERSDVGSFTTFLFQ